MAPENYYEIPKSLAELLTLAVESPSFKTQQQSWLVDLDSNVLTEEMRQVFIALGWITPRDRRVVRAK